MRVCANNCKNIHLDCFTFREGNFLMCLILTYNFCNNSYRYDTLVPSFPLNVFESRRICDKHRCLIPIPHMQHISLILSLFYTTGSARLLLPIPCYMLYIDTWLFCSRNPSVSIATTYLCQCFIIIDVVSLFHSLMCGSHTLIFQLVVSC